MGVMKIENYTGNKGLLDAMPNNMQSKLESAIKECTDMSLMQKALGILEEVFTEIETALKAPYEGNEGLFNSLYPEGAASFIQDNLFVEIEHSILNLGSSFDPESSWADQLELSPISAKIASAMDEATQVLRDTMECVAETLSPEKFSPSALNPFD